VVLMVVAVLLLYAAIPASIQHARSSAPLFSLAGLRANPVLLLPLFTCFAMLGFRTLFESTSRTGSVGPQYGPPQELTAMEAGVFIDGTVDPRDVIAGIVDLAVRGYLRIEPLAPASPDAQPGAPPADYAFHNLDRPHWSTELPLYDAALMQHIFQFGRRPMLSELRHGLADYLSSFRDKIFDSLVRKGLYRFDPRLGQALILLTGCAGLALVFGAAQMFDLAIADSPLIYALSFLLSGGVVYLFSRRISWCSAKGDHTLRELLGLKEFLQRVMEDRLRTLPLEQVEALLPYAIALGIEQAWAATFKDAVTKPLSWMVLPEEGEEGGTAIRLFYDSDSSARLVMYMTGFLDPREMQMVVRKMAAGS
jgi:predicted membrane protein DUF2207